MGKNNIIIIASEAKKAYLHANKRIIILPDIMTGLCCITISLSWYVCAMIGQFRGLYFMVPPSKFKICLNVNLHPPFEPEDTICILLTSFSPSVL